MTYSVTFYGLDAFGREAALTVHHVSPDTIAAYIDTPGVALAAVQRVSGNQKPCGYRVVDGDSAVVLDYRDKGEGR